MSIRGFSFISRAFKREDCVPVPVLPMCLEVIQALHHFKCLQHDDDDRCQRTKRWPSVEGPASLSISPRQTLPRCRARMRKLGMACRHPGDNHECGDTTSFPRRSPRQYKQDSSSEHHAVFSGVLPELFTGRLTTGRNYWLEVYPPLDRSQLGG